MKRFKFLIKQKHPKWIVGLISAAVFFAFLMGLFFATLPDVSPLKNHYPVFDRKTGDVSFSKRKPSQWVSRDQISEHVFGAIVVSEDWTFFSHNGVDWGELKAAVTDWIEDGGRLRGASTITQQLAKNIFYSNKRSYVRKLREFFTARDIEDVLSKKKILEYYVNIVEMGPKIYGVKRAANFYFNKQPSELNPKESAFIAMLLPSPERYSQSFRDRKITNYAQKTMTRILKKMARRNFISQDELDYWTVELLAFEDDFSIEALDATWAQVNDEDMTGSVVSDDEDRMIRYEGETETGEIVDMEIPASEATEEQLQGELPPYGSEQDQLDTENVEGE